MVNPKQKGGAFEREIAKRLSLWISHGIKSDILWRSAMSGGRATLGRARGDAIRQCGDLCAVAPEGHALMDRVFIEIKKYRDLNMHGLVTGNGLLMEFWGIACMEARQYKRTPVLIVRENRRAILLCTTQPGCLVFNISEPDVIVPRANMFISKFDDVLAKPYKEAR